jgi:hypothetical protein
MSKSLTLLFSEGAVVVIQWKFYASQPLNLLTLKNIPASKPTTLTDAPSVIVLTDSTHIEATLFGI